jgi:hypothetical protein
MGRKGIIKCRSTLNENREGSTNAFNASNEPRKKRLWSAGLTSIFARTREEICDTDYSTVIHELGLENIGAWEIVLFRIEWNSRHY